MNTATRTQFNEEFLRIRDELGLLDEPMPRRKIWEQVAPRLGDEYLRFRTHDPEWNKLAMQELVTRQADRWWT